MLVLRRALRAMAVVAVLAGCARSVEPPATGVAPPATMAPAPTRAVAPTEALPSATPAAEQQPATSRTTVESMESGGEARQYRLHVPPGYRPDQPTPLVIGFHGFNSNAAEHEQVTRMSDKADAAGFIAVYPEGLGNPQDWRLGSLAERRPDVTFIRDLIEHVRGRLNIDPQRIYVSGMSNGAIMSYHLVCDLADVFAAFAPVAGGYPSFGDCLPSRAIPAVVLHGTADVDLPIEGRPPLLIPVRDWAASWAKHNGCAQEPEITFQQGDVLGETWSACRDGADVVLYTIAGHGHIWPGGAISAPNTTRDINATDVIWEFFAAHPRL
jgi:polyhydroxybutyrate depolymerase